MKPTALLFSGQGAQYVGMGKNLSEAYPLVFEMYKEANAILGFDLAGVCFNGPEDTLTGTDYCQPALYLHGLALLSVLRERLPDFKFAAAAGLSLGEFTAHAAAETFRFDDGLRLVAARGKFMQEACKASNGGMISLIGGTHEQAEQVAEKVGLEVANYNCPGQIVLSGKKDHIPAAIEAAKEMGLKRAIPLNVAGAYHSSLMKPAQDKLKPILEKTKMTEPKVPVASNVTGTFSDGPKHTKEVLLKQVTGSVRWEACIHTLMGTGVERFIELGPGKVLQGLCRRIDKNIECLSIGNLADLEANLDLI